MQSSALHVGDRVVLQPPGLQALLDLLSHSGYRVIGPTVRDGAIVYDEILSIKSLPAGWTDEQSPGSYRLKKRRDEAFFGYAVGPHSWKQFLHPPQLTLFRAHRVAGAFRILPRDDDAPKYAFVGVRPCELAAIAVQDHVFLDGAYPNTAYKNRRDNAFIVAVNCTEPGGDCFCASMGSGPKTAAPYDLALTEVTERKRHFFVMDVGSDAGAKMASQLPTTPVAEEEAQAADTAVERAAGKMGRSLPIEGLRERLQRSYEDPIWEAMAARCMTCGNCTAVCPTCFCTTVEDVTDLTGEVAERRQRWDSCFNVDFSYIFGGSVRSGAAARYRQYLMHKFVTWQDQFGQPGCVGCGRCLTWCPAGLDLTETARMAGAGNTPDAGETRGKELAGGNS